MSRRRSASRQEPFHGMTRKLARIFGPRGYTVVDHVSRLPERLPMLYAGLTR